MKTLSLFIICLGLASGAQAQQVIDVVPEKTTETTPALTSAEADRDAKAKAKERFADRNCLRHTGSRLLNAEGNGRRCAIGNGRAFTREDLDRSGGVDIGSALRSLHPGIY